MNYNGGSAFPCNVPNFGEPDGFTVELGMTLRDYFAAKVMQGLMANPNLQTNGVEKNLPPLCYLVAEAMLKERAK